MIWSIFLILVILDAFFFLPHSVFDLSLRVFMLSTSLPHHHFWHLR